VDIVLAASLWGTSGTVRAFSPLSPLVAGAAKAVVGGAVLFLLAVQGGRLSALARSGTRVWASLGLGVACVAVFQTAFYAAVARTGVATGTVVTIGSAPAFAGLIALVSGQGRPSGRWAIATGGAVIGCALLVGGGQGTGVEPVGVAIALTSGLAYAVYATITSRLIAGGADNRAVVGVLFAGAAVLLSPLLLSRPAAKLGTVSGLVAAVYLGVVVTGVAYYLYARGLRTTPVTVATTLGLAEPAVAALLGLVALGEHLSGVALAGLALIATGLAIVR
jgi:DME family drug/metabolite transporter